MSDRPIRNIMREHSPNLRVTHQAFLQPNSQPMGLQLGKVVVVADVVHVGGVTVEDGISLFVVGKTPSVVDATRGAVSTRASHRAGAGF